MSHPDASPGPDPSSASLPPVEPPTAGFILQLFVIPALIVAVVIAVWLLFGKLAGGERDAMEYVRTIRSANENRRWRAAHELASLIGNDDRLARDPALLGELTGLLDETLDEASDPRIKLYLALSIGAFHTLDARSSAGRPVDPIAVLARALGEAQPIEVRLAAAESLARQAARLGGSLDDAGAAGALIEAAHDPEAELRKRATFALGFFGGTAIGEALRDRLGDEDRDVRFNAAFALGRRGDPAAQDVLREALSPGDLARVITLANPDESRRQIETILLAALQALQTSVRDGRPTLAQVLRPQVDALTRSDLVGVRTEAAALLKLLQGST